MACPAENQEVIDQSHFWDSNGIHWETHRIGWAVAGACTLLTVILSILSILSHCRNYRNRNEQRQILRILYLPPVYGIISFLSYRFFRKYTYYALVEIAYEAITISAFLLLLIEYVAATGSGTSVDNAISRKDKSFLPFPLCKWRFRPTKPYFMYTVKWSVLQYVIIRPSASVAAIICEHYHVLCQSEGFNFRFAAVYIEIIVFISISVALYGLIVFYSLTKAELKGRRPMAKFLAIKLVVMFTFYQSFVFDALEGRVLTSTDYWTVSNISHGLNALAICIEMVFFAAFMWWAYSANEYKTNKRTSIWRPLWDSINLSDMVAEIAGSLRFYWNAYQARRKGASSHTAERTARLNSHQSGQKADFAEAFGLYHGGGGSSTDSVNRSQDLPASSSVGHTDAEAGQTMPVRSAPPQSEGYTYGPPSVESRGYQHVSDERGST